MSKKIILKKRTEPKKINIEESILCCKCKKHSAVRNVTLMGKKYCNECFEKEMVNF